jgi:hypothetical protein
VQFCALDPASPEKVGESTNSALKTTSVSIATPFPSAKPKWKSFPFRSANPFNTCDQILQSGAGLHYTGKQPCASQLAFSPALS